MGKTLESEHNIRMIASRQQGHFTTRQACDAGYSYAAQYHQVAAGNWIREARSIYGLSDFPVGERPDLVLWSLWSRDRKGIPQGVYSHETALSIYELSDVMPAKLHMTVPTSFRKSAKTPDILVIHRARLAPADIQVREGYSVTRPLRTISDVAETISSDLLEQAIRQALGRGLVQRNELASVAGLHWSTR
jgi:predicted transcriptional regulator of viral defense system